MTIKLHGCGNKFLMVDEYNEEKFVDKQKYVREIANIENVDGVLFLSKSSDKNADLEMKIFDRDGTEEPMCGNGLRCFARYAYDNKYINANSKIITVDGIKKLIVGRRNITVSMGQPREYKKLDEQTYFVYTGVPHLVEFIEEFSLEKLRERGKKIRENKLVGKILGHEEGINVNFVIAVEKRQIDLVTYEMGVEDITKACGTGSTASAYVANKIKGVKFPITVRNLGGKLIIDYKNNELFMKGPAEYL